MNDYGIRKQIARGRILASVIKVQSELKLDDGTMIAALEDITRIAKTDYE